MALSVCAVVAAPSAATPAIAPPSSSNALKSSRRKRTAYKNMLHLLRRGLSKLSVSRDSARDGSTSSDIEMEEKRLGNGAVASQSSSPLRQLEEAHTTNEELSGSQASELRSSTDSSSGLRALSEIRAELRTLLPPSVYSDPFVVVTADGRIHVLNYFQEHRAGSNLVRAPDVYSPATRHTIRRLDISRIRVLYHALALECREGQLCKSWGITANSVWWAADSHRNIWEGDCCNIVLEDDSSGLRAGFTVIHAGHFLAALRALGLPDTCRIISGLPPIPIQSRQLPFIDEDEDAISDREASRASSIRVESPTYAHQILQEERASSRLSNASSIRRN